MRIALTIYSLACALTICSMAADPTCIAPSQAPSRIELPDQFEKTHSLVFPTTNITLLTIADKTGSEQIAGWVEPIKKRFDDRVAIEGIADVSAVPGLLRGLVRRKFQKAQTHPVMLDWSGTVIGNFAPVPDKANIYVLDREGRILTRLEGDATDDAVKELCELLDKALAEARKQVVSR